MKSDSEILNEIEKVVDAYTKFMYDENSTDEEKRSLGTFYMGQIWGTLVKERQV